MYGDGPRLRLPQLKYEKSVRIGKSKRDEPVYRLDWTALEAWRRKKHGSWARRWCSEAPEACPYIDPLPATVDSVYLSGARFCVSRSYHSELARNARRAVEEWCIHRPFDTMIRDRCVSPAIAHVEVTVDLLVDCLYDGETGTWDRDHDRRMIVAAAILWKIWYMQTGGGSYWKRARMDGLVEYVREGHLVFPDKLVVGQTYGRSPASPRIAEFVEAMSKHWTEMKSVHRRPKLGSDEEEE